MALSNGTKLGPYDVVAPLGAGGMGEVYRARDTRLARDVAVKVLPASFSENMDRLRRFEQEARAAAVLDHPNILAIHDVGNRDGCPYVVTELLEGETLRERIGGTPLPVRKAIDYASQMARGLATAHEKGIVHRDLKPENVFLTRDGRVKILDFGLAKLTGPEAWTEAQTNTAGPPAGTDRGTVLGTVGYMSPEQVRARPVDHRSDIFSFGAVLYEMLSGRRAFRGASAVETMNAILKEDPPDLSETGRHLPPALERIVSHCLEKNPEERFQSARDVAFDLEALSDQSGSSAAATAPTVEARARAVRWRGLFAAALGALLIAAGSFVLGRRSAQAPLPEFQPLTFRRGNVESAAFAPDGRTIVYAARWEGGPRDLFSTQPGSPESRSLGLRDAQLAGVSSSGEMAILHGLVSQLGGTLARVPLGGGAPRDVLENVFGASWGPDGNSFAVVRFTGPRNRLEFPVGRTLYESPGGIQFARVSPRGDRVAFTDHPLLGDNRGDVAVVDLSGKKRTLSEGWEDVGGLAWSADGSEVWFTATKVGSDRALFAVTQSGVQRLVARVPGNLVLRDISRDGKVLVSHGNRRPVIMGLAPGETKERELSWLDYSIAADLSRDGRKLLFSEQGVGGGPEYAVYLRATDGSAAVRLGKGNAQALSPDEKWALAVDLASPTKLVLLPTGAGEARTLPRHMIDSYQSASFLPDGKRILVLASEPGRGIRLYVQELAGGRLRAVAPEAVVTFFNTVSPDGRFVAAKPLDGEARLYPLEGGDARPIPGLGAGDVPLSFSGDGRFLYFREWSSDGLPVKVQRLEVSTGRREPWKELAPSDPTGVGGIGTILIAPDGRSYAYGYIRNLTGLYLVEGLK